MLRWRLLVAFLILAPLIALLVLDYQVNFGAPGIWLIPLALLAASIAVSEVLSLLRAKQLEPVAWVVHASCLLILAAALVPLLWPLTGEPYPPDCPMGRLGLPLAAAALCVPIMLISEMARFGEPGQSIIRVSVGLFTIFYVGLQFSFFVFLRTFHSNAWGMAAIVSLVFVVKMSDTGAYFVGRLLGRRKMSPRLSPKKTVEGAIGGFVVACVCSWLYFRFIVPQFVPGAAPPGLVGVVLYGVILAAAGMVGDLGESLLKRDMECKDSSSWMPGLGGVLDVLDSLFVAAPAAYLCWVAQIVGP